MTHQSPPSPPPSLWELHPVEAFLALLLISAAALLQLVANPPQPLRKRQALDHSHVLDSYFYSKTALASALAASQTRVAMAAAVQETVKQLRQPQSSSAPAHNIAPSRPLPNWPTAPWFTVAQLRSMARQQGITTANGRPIHKARRADLIAVLNA